MKLIFSSAVFVAVLASVTSIEDQAAISTPSKEINTSFHGYVESLVAINKEKEDSGSEVSSSFFRLHSYCRELINMMICDL